MPKAKNAQLWERDPDDWYVEPEWVSQALFRDHRFRGRIADPCAGTGRIVRAAQAAGYDAHGVDFKRRAQFDIAGYHDWRGSLLYLAAETIVSNPPYRDSVGFIDLALALKRDVAVFLELRFLAGEARTRWLERTCLSDVLVCTPRPSCPPGAVILAGEAPGGGSQDFCWLIFRQGHQGRPTFGWLRKDA